MAETKLGTVEGPLLKCVWAASVQNKDFFFPGKEYFDPITFIHI